MTILKNCIRELWTAEWKKKPVWLKFTFIAINWYVNMKKIIKGVWTGWLRGKSCITLQSFFFTMPENDHHLPLLQCASTVIIWIDIFFYGIWTSQISKAYYNECDIFPECDVLLWQSLEQFSHLENPDLRTIYQTNSGSEVTRPSLWPAEMNTQR